MQKTKIYTEQEKEFLTKALDLFKLPYTTEDGNDGLSYTLFSIDNSDIEAYALVTKCLQFNFKRTYCR